MKRKELLKLVVGFSLVAVLAISIPLVSGCTSPAEAPTPVKESIKVGVATTVTGPLDDDGRHHVRGIDMSVDECNIAGGLLGRPVEMVVADLGWYSPQELQAVTDTLRDADVDVINYNWTVYPAVTDYLIDTGIFVMHHGWVTIDWQQWYDNYKDTFPYWMTLNRTEQGYGVPYFQALSNPGMIDWEFPNKKAAILVCDLDYSVIQAEWWREEAEKAGWEIVFYEIHALGNIEFGAQMAKIRAEDPAIVFMCSVISEEVIAAYNDFIQEPTNSLFCMTWVVSKPELLDAFGDQANGIIGTVPGMHFVDTVYTGNDPQYITHYEKTKALFDKGLERYGERPSLQCMCAADSFWVWAEAVERVGSTDDYDAIMEDMFNHTYVGACGAFGFDRDTHAQDYGRHKLPIGYFQVQDGKVETLAVGAGTDVELIKDFEVPWWIEQ